jgi:hypothetical protein
MHYAQCRCCLGILMPNSWCACVHVDSPSTDGFAMGVVALMILTGRPVLLAREAGEEVRNRRSKERTRELRTR